jgi:hypothetical protein
MVPQDPNPQFRDQARLIPWWSYVLAIGFFVGIQLVIHMMLLPGDPRPRPLALTTVWGLLLGMFLAFYMLMIGFVMRDARKRGMNPTIWLFILVSLLPSGVGFIVYFLLRQPVAMRCPQCATPISADSNYCTRCQHQLRAVCPECRHSLRPGDIYCGECGTATALDEAPLRAAR